MYHNFYQTVFSLYCVYLSLDIEQNCELPPYKLLVAFRNCLGITTTRWHKLSGTHSSCSRFTYFMKYGFSIFQGGKEKAPSKNHCTAVTKRMQKWHHQE
jgi:hypothetical protein